MRPAAFAIDGPSGASDDASGSGLAGQVRLAALVDAHYDLIARSVRRLGVPAGDVDDAAQQVFLIAARKLHEIRPGAERSFLFQTALRVAADSRRARRRRREVNEPSGDSEAVVSGAPLADDLVDLYRARKQLDEILDGMPLDLRAVFVLTEFEQFTMAEIATLLELSPGTVASRLRRARAEFTAKVDRIAAQNLHLEGRR